MLPLHHWAPAKAPLSLLLIYIQPCTLSQHGKTILSCPPERALLKPCKNQYKRHLTLKGHLLDLTWTIMGSSWPNLDHLDPILD